MAQGMIALNILGYITLHVSVFMYVCACVCARMRKLCCVKFHALFPQFNLLSKEVFRITQNTWETVLMIV